MDCERQCWDCENTSNCSIYFNNFVKPQIEEEMLMEELLKNDTNN